MRYSTIIVGTDGSESAHRAVEQAAEIAEARSARLLDMHIEEAGAREIAGRSRGTPRISNRLLRRVRDYAQVRADGRITTDVAARALALLEVDEHGFDEVDRRLLRTTVKSLRGLWSR